MRDNSMLLIVDYNKHGFIPQGPDSDKKFEPEEVEAFLTEAGFARTKSDTKSLKHQYIVKCLKGSFDKPAES